MSTKVESAKTYDGESPFLDRVVDHPWDVEPKRAYADWLEEAGDSTKAEFLRQLVVATETFSVDDMPELEAVPGSWARVVGAELLGAMIEGEIDKERAEAIFQLALPTLIYEDFQAEFDAGDPAEFEKDPEFKIGASKIFGLPDLPQGSQWPRQKDCNTFYDEGSGIDPETACSFVCQINFEELAGTQAARWLPQDGLLSIFSCAEIESIGMTDAYVTYTPKSEMNGLVRLDAPEDLADDEANALLDAVAFEFTESLIFPYCDSESPFEAVKFGYQDEQGQAIDKVLESFDGGQLHSVLGYTRPTSGADPMPGKEYCKLICIQNTLEQTLHFCIKKDDLKAANFKNVELAWVDFD